MSSLGETKAIGLAKSQGNPFVRHTQKHFVRTYPKGTRTDSSNYEPYDAWNTGCQIGKSLLLPDVILNDMELKCAKPKVALMPFGLYIIPTSFKRLMDLKIHLDPPKRFVKIS